MGLRRKVLLAAAGLAASYALLCGLVAYKQTSLMFFPSARLEATPKELGLAYQDWNLESSDGALIHAWQIPPPEGQSGGWILHCHGNGGNISHRLDVAREFHRLGLGVVLFDYRGYGQSQGQLQNEKQLLADGQAVYDRLAALGQPIVLYGESLGGGIASYLAEKNPCAGLVLQSTFTRLTDRACEAYPFLPVRQLCRFQLNTLDRLPKIHQPVLVMHGRLDEVIGFHHGQALFARANQPKHWEELSGGHNSIDPGQLAQALDRWLKEQVRP